VRKKMEAFRKFFIMLMLAAVLLSPFAFTGTALATEGGGGAYPNGAEDFMAGALPPPASRSPLSSCTISTRKMMTRIINPARSSMKTTPSVITSTSNGLLVSGGATIAR